MAIKRYISDADTTITNAFKENLTLRGTGSNMGASDVLETFSIYGQTSSSAGASSEISRILLKFPTTTISSDRTAGTIPASGSVNFFLKLANAEHHRTVPTEYTASILAVSQSWVEGYGLDLDNYRDNGEANWINRDTGTTWGEATAASAILTMADGDLTTANQFTEGEYVKMIATDGTVGIFILSDASEGGAVASGTVLGASSDLGTGVPDSDLLAAGTCIAVTCNLNTNSQAVVLNEIKDTILHANSPLKDKITAGAYASVADGEQSITFTQVTVGTSGNTVTTTNISQLTAADFTGGTAAQEGGIYHTGSVPEAYSAEIRYTEVFGEDASQDLEVDITPLVEHWIAGTVANYGVGVMLSGSYEDGSALRSYYTKKFFSRTSEYFYKRPTIEARWNNSKTDDRSNFYASSSLVASENYNTLFLYNYARGQLADIPGLADGKIGIKLYRDALTDNVPETVHGGVCPLAPVGVYTASVAIDTSASVLYDVWYTGSTEFYTGTVAVKNFAATADNPNSLYVTSLPNLKPAYSTKETARFRFFTRKQNWSPTIYTTATAITNSEVVDSAYYKIFRISDGYEVIPYGTGSDQHTKMSYDQSGSYFDLDMSMLQTDYAYGLSVVYYLNGKYVEQSEIFKFRVEG
jgi:hypothetical protein